MLTKIPSRALARDSGAHIPTPSSNATDAVGLDTKVAACASGRATGGFGMKRRYKHTIDTANDNTNKVAWVDTRNCSRLTFGVFSSVGRGKVT